MKKLFYTLLGMSMMFAGTVYALPYFRSDQTIIPFQNNAYDLGTSTAKWRSLYLVGSDGCLQLTSGLVSSTGTACGSGGGGGGSDTNWTYFNNSGIRPATSTVSVLINGTATTTRASLQIIPTAGLMPFSVGSTTTLFEIETSGNIGIGTATAGAKLEVAGSILVSNAGTLTMPNGDGTKILLNGAAQTDAITKSTGSVLNVISSGPLTFQTNGANERMRITSTGNVGIGTTSPVYPLTVYQTSNNYNIQSQRLGGAGVGLWTSTAIGALYTTNNYQLELGTNGNTQMAITTAGNIGIGTSSPQEKLSISAGNLLFTNANSLGTTQGIIKFANPNYLSAYAGIAGITDPSAGLDQTNLAFYSGFGSAMERMRITSGGNVGIGTTSPQSILNISAATPEVRIDGTASNGAFSIYNSGTKYGLFGVAYSATQLTSDSSVNDVILRANAGQRLLLSANGSGGASTMALLNGNVGIGTTTPSALLAVNAPAGQASFAIGSSTKTSFIVDKNGNVGVGTASPASKFNLNNTTTPSALTAANAASNFVFTANGPGFNRMYFENQAGTSGQRVFSFDNNGGVFSIHSYSDNATAYVAQNILNVTYNGKVGIGTSTPAWKLQVAGTRPDFTLSDSAGGTNLKHIVFSNRTGNLYVGPATDAYATSTPILTLLNGGNVGIASSTPGSLFSVGNTNGINFSTATSTFSSTGGINLTSGCFAIGGACIAGGSFTNTIASGGTGSTAFSPNSIITSNAAGTALIATGTQLTVGNLVATSTTATSLFSGILQVVTRFIGVISAAFTPSTEGEIGIDTTSNQMKYYSNGGVRVLSPVLYSSFGYATSTSWTGTTTRAIGPAIVGQIFVSVTCFTDTGTVQVSINDGSNRMNFLNASTTANLNALTTNNSFTALEKRYVDLGTPASSPTSVSCTVGYTIDAD